MNEQLRGTVLVYIYIYIVPYYFQVFNEVRVVDEVVVSERILNAAFN